MSLVKLLATLLVFTTVCLALGQRASKTNREADRLIDQLVNFGSEGTDFNAYLRRFLAIDELPIGPFSDPVQVPVDPTMRKLVRMGVDALPSLIKHLRDSRKTRCRAVHGDTWSMSFCDYYPSRYTDPRRSPAGVNTSLIKEPMQVPREGVQLCVGDLCFEMVGQIVNRNFSVVLYVPTSQLLINSPIHCPGLSDAVVKEWTGLDKTSHRKQLEQDAIGVCPCNSPYDAIQRLLFYYRDDGEKLAIKLLNRHIYDFDPIFDIADAMMKSDDEKAWKEQYTFAVRKLGREQTEMLPGWIYDHYNGYSVRLAPETRPRAAKLLKKLFPSFTPDQNIFHNFVSLDEQRYLVESLRAFPSQKIDTAVQSFFRKAVVGGSDDKLAEDCAMRLVGKGFDSEYLTYFKRRLSELTGSPTKPSYSYETDPIREWIKRLEGQTPPQGAGRTSISAADAHGPPNCSVNATSLK